MKWFTHWFTPHHTNNHKARILHSSSITVIIGFLLLFLVAIPSFVKEHNRILGIATDINVEDLLRYTNEEREKSNLKPLQLNPDLSKAAKEKATYMFEHDYWAHTAPDGTTPWDFFKKVGYNYIHAGENLAREFDYSQNVVQAWMASSSHRDNILRSEYRDIGFAVVNGKLNGEETTLVVQLFGTKQPTLIAPEPVKLPESTATAYTFKPSNKPVLKTLIPQVAGLTRSPNTDIFAIVKGFSILLGLVFMAILTIDGMILWRKRVVRLSSHSLAHIIFLASLIGAMWFTGIGAIL